MKIGNLEPKAPVASVGQERKAPAAGQAPAAGAGAAAGEASAKVQLSDTASMLVQDSTPEFDAEKVKRIAQAIRDGKYEINAEAIADKLIGNAQELLGKSSH